MANVDSTLSGEVGSVVGLSKEGSGEILASSSPWQIALRALSRDGLAMFGLAVIGLLAVVTIASPWMAPFDPVYIDAESILVSPAWPHVFGTDDLGRDVLSRVLWGGRESLVVAMLAVAIALTGGTLIGLSAGYFGGLLDSILMRLVDILLAFPTILLLLSIVAMLGPSLVTVLVAAGFSSIPGYARVVRSSVLATRNLEYVTAARVVGAKDRRIMLVHILPNCLAPIIVYSTIGLGYFIFTTAGLSYIGLGAQPPSPEWGAMLNYGRSYLRDAWWMSVFPGVAISMAVLSVNLLGDGLRDALDPKLRNR